MLLKFIWLRTNSPPRGCEIKLPGPNQAPVNSKIKDLNVAQTNQIIRMAWADRITFEEIERRTGFTEPEVIQVMRRELRPRSFKRWRERVSGRVTKHQKRFRAMEGGRECGQY